MANNVHADTAVPGGNYQVVASAARTATPDTEEFTIGSDVDAIVLLINTSAAGASPSTVPKIEGVDRTSGAVWTLLTGAAITATGVVALTVGTGVTASANVAAGLPVPPVIRVTFTHGNGTSHTYSARLISI